MSKRKYNVNYSQEQEVEVETEEIVVEDPVEAEPVVEEQVKEEPVIEEVTITPEEELVPELKETEEMRQMAKELPRDEVLKNRIRYLEAKIKKSNNPTDKCWMFEKLKQLNEELKSLKGEYYPIEIKAVENCSTIAKHKEEKESMFGTRGQVVGIEGMFVKL